MSVCYEPGSTNWIPGRGDYGCEYGTDLTKIIERLNCSLGCTRAGTQAERDEFGPGGTCHIIDTVILGDSTPVPDLDPRPEGPHCRARQDPATAGMDPLFPEVTG